LLWLVPQSKKTKTGRGRESTDHSALPYLHKIIIRVNLSGATSIITGDKVNSENSNPFVAPHSLMTIFYH